MARVTIIREDNFVSIDGEGFTVDCSTLPAEVHAVQWDGVRGEIEYIVCHCEHCGSRSKKGNETISDFSPYAPLVVSWGEAKKKHAAEKAAREAEQQRKKQEHDEAVRKRLAEKAAEAAEREALKVEVGKLKEHANAAGPKG